MTRSSAPSLARRERTELCDLVLAVGADAPTLCEGWDAADLVTHLLARERRPLAAAGIVIPALAPLTDRTIARYRRQDFGVLVERLRSPGLTPYALPPVERALNTLEYVVHHEDLRRAQPGWEPRDLDPSDLDLVWALVRGGSAWLGRSLPVPVVLRRADTGAAATVREGSDPVTITGPVVELVLFLVGRDETRGLVLDGPGEAVRVLRAADLGI